MDLAELNNLFIGDNFFYHSKYLGIVEYIYHYDMSNYYSVKVYNRKNLYNIPDSYMMECYINKLKKMRMILLKNREITRLVHFTPISNLESIFERGMLSRNILYDSDIEYCYSDDFRFDNKLDYICNSISFPNYKMFYSKRMEDLNIEWAVLSIDSDLLVSKLDTEFYRMNAASNDPFKYKYNVCSNDALEYMFYPEDRALNLPRNYTTNPQAEVLVKDSIHPSYIKCIDTCGLNDTAKSIAINCGIYYNKDSNLFGPRKDYKRW